MAGNAGKGAKVQGTKRHSACDDCRSRKLQCSSALDGCARCLRDGLSCTYSLQRPMGRPRKRRRSEDPSRDNQGYKIARTLLQESEIQEHSPQLNTQSFQADLRNSSNTFTNSDGFSGQVDYYTALLDHSIPPNELQDIRLDLDLIDSVDSTYENESININNLDTLPCSTPEIPDCCGCLFSLSSTLSRLQQSFQDDWASYHTISLLRSSFRTAKSAYSCVRCSTVMTLAFQMQMMLGTLLPLIVEGYRRVLDSIEEEITRLDSIGELKVIGPEEIADFGMEHQGPAFHSLSTTEYRERAREIVRSDVLGIGEPKDMESIAGLIAIMRRRQKERHENLDKMIGLEAQNRQPGCREPLCLKIIDHTSDMIKNLRLHWDHAEMAAGSGRSHPSVLRCGSGPKWGRVSFFGPIINKLAAWT